MAQTSEPFKVGIAGLGTVGVGVVKILQQNAKLVQNRSGRPIEIIAVTANNKDKDRGVDLSSYQWADDIRALAQDDNIDCFVECIGGDEGVVKETVETALKNGKHVVTANKALLAKHGVTLSKIAEENDCSLIYEAAVAGGIPIIKTIREGLAANRVYSVFGILNGTCNYILTTMEKTGRDFDDVLKEAQDLGYAEADPSFDIDGIDSAHKLVLLAALCFGVEPDFDALEISGIRHLSAADIAATKELGYRIKLLGIARHQDGEFIQTLEACLVPEGSAIAQVDDAYNAVMTEGDFVEQTFMQGKGAGEGPTASSIIADIIDLAKGHNVKTFGVPTNDLIKVEWRSSENFISACYLNITVQDKPGVMAEITAALAENNISIDSLLQHGHSEDGRARIIILTQETSFQAAKESVKSVEGLDCVLDKPTLLRVEKI